MTKNKSKIAYRTIGEAAKEIGLVDSKTNKVSTHTLRFWEKNFKQIKPKILFGNRRYYSKNDIDILKQIHNLLKKEGFTIHGAKKILNKGLNELDPEFMSDIKEPKVKKNIQEKVTKIKKIINRLKKVT
tara:strand:- start:5681 stop:6067 length:387 start_codon:yes stop_codon:yes gene_type:complete